MSDEDLPSCFLALRPPGSPSGWSTATGPPSFWSSRVSRAMAHVAQLRFKPSRLFRLWSWTPSVGADTLHCLPDRAGGPLPCACGRGQGLHRRARGRADPAVPRSPRQALAAALQAQTGTGRELTPPAHGAAAGGAPPIPGGGTSEAWAQNCAPLCPGDGGLAAGAPRGAAGNKRHAAGSGCSRARLISLSQIGCLQPGSAVSSTPDCGQRATHPVVPDALDPRSLRHWDRATVDGDLPTAAVGAVRGCARWDGHPLRGEADDQAAANRRRVVRRSAAMQCQPAAGSLLAPAQELHPPPSCCFMSAGRGCLGPACR